MSAFTGFPPNTGYVAIPAAFFSDLLPQIADEAELRVSLHLFWLLSQKQRPPRAVLRSVLLADAALTRTVSGGAAAIARGLKLAAARGTFLVAPTTQESAADAAYAINIEAGRRDLALIAAGRLAVAGAQTGLAAGPSRGAAPRPNIFQLYEENIGLITPLLAEELREAETRFPAGWVEEAFRLAVERNHRKWSYIAAVLERWAAEGLSPERGGKERDALSPGR